MRSLVPIQSIYIFTKLVTKANLLQTSFKLGIPIKTYCMQNLRHSKARMLLLVQRLAWLYMCMTPQAKEGGYTYCWHWKVSLALTMWPRKITRSHVCIPAPLWKREADVVKDTKLVPYTFPSPSHKAWGAQREELGSEGTRQQQLGQLDKLLLNLNSASSPLLVCFSLLTQISSWPFPASSFENLCSLKLPHNYGVKYCCSLTQMLFPAHYECTLESQGRSLPCGLYLYSTRSCFRVTNPRCCNKYGNRVSQEVWTLGFSKRGSQMPGSEPSKSRTSTHIEVYWETGLRSSAASGTAQEITELIWSKASFPTETWPSLCRGQASLFIYTHLRPLHSAFNAHVPLTSEEAYILNACSGCQRMK